MTIIWKSIIGYEGLYQISNDGQVRSLDRVDCVGQIRKGKIITQGITRDKKGKVRRLGVGLCKEGIRINKQVHRLVAEAFIENSKKRLIVCHKDGDATNNRITNLYYGTHQMNSDDAIQHGTKARGEMVAQAVLTEKQAFIIKYSKKYRGSGTTLAVAYGVTPTIISRIRSGKIWRHI